MDGITLAEIPGIVSNPFNPPTPGSDDPHQGMDLADQLPGSQVTLKGRTVQAVLSGQVAGVIQDRFPYGNAVLVEVSLENQEAAYQELLGLPTPEPVILQNPSLTCPTVAPPYPASQSRSLYLLYAHLLEPSTLQVGQEVRCGEALGKVGDSGNALNPHLHLEVRVGPQHAVFPSMAHYDNRSTAEEMGLYCLWRVSGTFQVVNPLALFLPQP